MLSVGASTTGMPWGFLAENAKFRSFLIKILPRGPVGPRSRDNLWQRGNDALRQCRETPFHAKAQTGQRRKERRRVLILCAFALFAPLRETDAFLLVSVAGAGGEFARVFGAAAWALVRGTAAWSGVWTTALVAHLGR